MERLRQMRPCIAAIGCLCFSNQSAISAISPQLSRFISLECSFVFFFYTIIFSCHPKRNCRTLQGLAEREKEGGRGERIEKRAQERESESERE